MVAGADMGRLLTQLRKAPGSERTHIVAEAPAPWQRALTALVDGPDPERALAQAGDLPAQLIERGPISVALARLLHQGSYPARLLRLAPEAASVLADGPADPAVQGEDLTAELLDRAAREGVEDAFGRVRTREYLRIARLEAEDAPLERIGGDLSSLAAGFVDAALRHVDPQLPEQVVVFGMGKLGGNELNFLSDIDLIFVHGDDVVPDDPEHAHEALVALHGKLRRVVRLLEGDAHWRPLFRVDLRLRPFGSRGSLSMSVSAMEAYYERHGRAWERQMWIRGRPVAGRLELGEQLLQRLRPFVFRRSVSESIIREVADLMKRARREARGGLRRHDGVDLKLDTGGIREIEFFAQGLQLLHGGRNSGLRQPGTLPALDRLFAAGLISDREHRQLVDAYRFFRRAEHRVQLADGQQTHRLPAQDDERALLARRLAPQTAPGEALSWIDEQVARRRLQVSAIAQTLQGPSEDERVSDVERDRQRSRDAVVDPGAPASVRIEALRELGLHDPEEAQAVLQHLFSRDDGVLASRGAGRAGGEQLLLACLDSADPDAALHRFVDFAALRPAHFAVWRFLAEPLRDGPDVLRLTAELFGSSEPLSRGLIGFPAERDHRQDWSIGLLLGAAEPELPNAAEITALLAGFEPDPRGKQATLLQFKHRELVRIGLYDLGRRPDPLQVGQALSDLADAVTRELLEHLAAQTTEPGPPLRLAVLALGKYGMQAMDYGSDLDLMLVFEPAGADEASAEQREAAIRIGRRLLAMLQDPQYGTRLYEVDMRLRPSGRQGLLVSSLDSFRRYHEGDLPAWERVAMLRVRTVAEACFGGAVEPRQSLGTRAVEEIVQPSLRRPIPPTAAEQSPVAAGIRELRDRIQREVSRETRDRYDVKSGRGGCLELELLVGALQLLHVAEHPEVGVRGIVEGLTALGTAGLVGDHEVEALSSAYRFQRLLLNRLRMGRGFDHADHFSVNSPTLTTLARRMGLPDRDVLVTRYLDARQTIRDAFDRHLS